MSIQDQLSAQSLNSVVEVSKETAAACFQPFGRTIQLVIAWVVSQFLPGVVFAITILVATIAAKMMNGQNLITVLISIIGVIPTGAMFAGWTRVTLKVARGQDVVLRDLLCPVPMILNAVAALALYWAVVGVGYLLLLIPGLYLQVRLQFAPYFCVDREENCIEALKSSWDATENTWVAIGLFNLVCFILSSVSGFTIIGPLIITIVGAVGVALIYDKLKYGSLVAPAKITIADDQLPDTIS